MVTIIIYRSDRPINKKGGMQVTDKELRARMKKSPAEARRALFDEYCNYVYAIVINKLRNC